MQESSSLFRSNGFVSSEHVSAVSSGSFAKHLGTGCWPAISSINSHPSRCFLSRACICPWVPRWKRGSGYSKRARGGQKEPPRAEGSSKTCWATWRVSDCAPFARLHVRVLPLFPDQSPARSLFLYLPSTSNIPGPAILFLSLWLCSFRSCLVPLFFQPANRRSSQFPFRPKPRIRARARVISLRFFAFHALCRLSSGPCECWHRRTFLWAKATFVFDALRVAAEAECPRFVDRTDLSVYFLVSLQPARRAEDFVFVPFFFLFLGRFSECFWNGTLKFSAVREIVLEVDFSLWKLRRIFPFHERSGSVRFCSVIAVSLGCSWKSLKEAGFVRGRFKFTW